MSLATLGEPVAFAADWYDCFDTLVTRVAIAPTDVFTLLAWRLSAEGLLANADVDAFARLRADAEAALRARMVSGEVTLVALYREIASRNGWTRREAARAARLEIETEGRVLVPIRGRFERALARRDRTPVVISDTYFSARVIGAFLRTWSDDSWRAPHVFSSADLQRTKADGALFRHVLETTGSDPAEVVHHGDHPVSDDARPRELGLRTEPVAPPGVLAYEYGGPTPGGCDAFERIVGGAMRATRVAADPAADAGEIEAFGGHGAAALVGYVAWLLTEAKRRGLARLWFLARDGQVLIEIAKRLAPLLHPAAELRYVYASRLAWCLPAYPDLDIALDRWLGRYLHGATPHEIGDALDLDADDVAELLDRASGRPLPAGGSASTLERRFAERSMRARRGLIGYLRDEGLLCADRAMLVDVGWNGSLQLALRTVLEESGLAVPAPMGVYVALRRRPTELAPDEVVEYAPGETRINAAVVELLTRADHGSTLGFSTVSDGHHAPVLQPLDPSRAEAVRRAQRLIVGHAEALVRWMATPGFPTDAFVGWIATHGRERLVSLCRTPSNAVGRSLAAQVHDDGPGHARVASPARRYDRIALWRKLVDESFGGRTSWWLEGSIAASTLGRRDFMVHLYAQRLMLRVARGLRRGAGA